MSDSRLKIVFVAAVFISLLCNTGLSQDLTEAIICPKKLTEIAEIGDCGSKVNFTEPFVNIADEHLVTIQNNYSSGSFFQGGESTVYYKATDKVNNTYFCIFKVNVRDQQRPEFTAFPSDMVVEASSATGAMVHWEEPEAIDNCHAASLISSHNSGVEFPMGKTEVTYWAYDESGNHIQRSFTITVVSGEDHLVSASKN